MIQTLLAFIFALGTLVIFHELGHFWVARLCGVRVLRFSVGIGKPILTWKFGESDTEWTVSALPLGGYVKMFDSRETPIENPTSEQLAGDFSRKNVWKRIAIVIAGPAANFLLAVVLFCALFIIGSPDPIAKLRVPSTSSIAYQAGLRHGDKVVAIDGANLQSWSELRWNLLQKGLDKQDPTLRVSRLNPDRPSSSNDIDITLPLSQLSTAQLESDFLNYIGIGLFRPAAQLKEVIDAGPASKAGLKAGDQILEIDGHPLLDSQELVEIVNAAPNKPLQMLVRAGEQEFALTVTPEAKSENGKTVGRIQVLPNAAVETVHISYSLGDALPKAVQQTWQTSVLTLKMFGKILTGAASWKNLTGPITIADYAGQTARLGLITYISFIALISISLGVMNLLPIPVLDGGHLLYYSLEVFTGKPIPEKYAEMAQRGGLAVLLCLMVVALFNDFVRLMS